MMQVEKTKYNFQKMCVKFLESLIILILQSVMLKC